MEDKIIKAGKIAAQALKFAEGLIKPEVKLVDVCDKVEEKIKELGGGLAFPVQISMNDAAAHFCPALDDETVFKDELVSIDIGVHIDGYIGGDTALTVDLSGKNAELVKASRDALDNALKLIKPGVKINEIGKVIHDTITAAGFSPIRNLSGHGLDRWSVHIKPSIPNYDNGDESVLEKGMIIAIEPFASTGAGVVYESSPATVFQLMNKKPVRNMITRQVLKEIETFEDLPFCSRWLEKKFGTAKVSFALRDLKNLNIIKEYPPLLDKAHGLVSQAEHSVLVKENSVVLTKL